MLEWYAMDSKNFFMFWYWDKQKSQLLKEIVCRTFTITSRFLLNFNILTIEMTSMINAFYDFF